MKIRIKCKTCQQARQAFTVLHAVIARGHDCAVDFREELLAMAAVAKDSIWKATDDAVEVTR